MRRSIVVLCGGRSISSGLGELRPRPPPRASAASCDIRLHSKSIVRAVFSAAMDPQVLINMKVTSVDDSADQPVGGAGRESVGVAVGPRGSAGPTRSDNVAKKTGSRRIKRYSQSSQGSALIANIMSAHPIALQYDGVTDKDTKPFACDECGKRFSNRSNLNSHMKIHSGIRPHVCTTCGSSFSVKSNLTTHIRTHTGERPFACAYCSQRFVENSSLTKHTRIHTGEKPFVCPDCGLCFAINSNLTLHRRKHTGDRPFGCRECGHQFADRSSLVRHARVHTGERPFRCTECTQSFASCSNLKRHVRTHTGEKPFPCNHCGRRFAVHDKLKKHRAREHERSTEEILPSPGLVRVLRPYVCSECREVFKERSHLIKHFVNHIKHDNTV